MTKSHALENKYNEEDEQVKEETQSTSLEKLPTPQVGVCWLCLLKSKKKQKAELLLHKKHWTAHVLQHKLDTY